MQINSVHYQRVFSLGNYENERVGAWAQIDESESPEESLAALKTWVEQRGNQTAEACDTLEQIRQSIQAVEARKRQLAREYEQMREIWNKARSFLTSLGLEVPHAYIPDDDIPF